MSRLREHGAVRSASTPRRTPSGASGRSRTSTASSPPRRPTATEASPSKMSPRSCFPRPERNARPHVMGAETRRRGWRLRSHHERRLHSPLAGDVDRAPCRRRRLRRLPSRRRGVGPPADLPQLRSRRLLRLLPRPPRDRAPPGNRARDHPVARAWRVVVLVLRRRDRVRARRTARRDADSAVAAPQLTHHRSYWAGHEMEVTGALWNPVYNAESLEKPVGLRLRLVVQRGRGLSSAAERAARGTAPRVGEPCRSRGTR